MNFLAKHPLDTVELMGEVGEILPEGVDHWIV
jgi:hypothetical protein